jgi:thiosulfate/3-mercaptopyruvate sulfurtransferase
MPFRTLIDTATLAARLGDPALVVVDCRFQLRDTAWGRREYETAHVPGAAYAHLDRDLSGPTTGTNGRHPLPAPDAAAAAFGRLGIGNGIQVVAYDQNNGSFASRLWWMLRWLGHDDAAVLDGGFAKWTAEGRPTSAAADAPAPRVFHAAPRPELLLTAQDVAARLHDPSWRLLDARAPERYRGDVEPLDRIGGHIPGAVNRPFRDNVDEQGVFQPGFADSLRNAIGDTPIDRVVNYCGSGVTACHNVLALEHAGLHGSKLYAGSWSEWSSDPSRPMAKGEHS